MCFGIELVDVSAIAARSEFRVFTGVSEAGGKVRALVAPGCAGYSRKQVGELEEIAQDAGAKGLATIAVLEDGTPKSTIAKFFSDDLMTELIKEVDDMTQPLKVQQRQVGVTLSCRALLGLARVGPAHRHGRVRTISKAQDQVGIDAAADGDNLASLATEGMMGMGDRHRFQSGLG